MQYTRRWRCFQCGIFRHSLVRLLLTLTCHPVLYTLTFSKETKLRYKYVLQNAKDNYRFRSDRQSETKQGIEGKIVRFRLGRVRDRVRDKDLLLWRKVKLQQVEDSWPWTGVGMSTVQSAWIIKKHSASATDKIGTDVPAPHGRARLPFTSAGGVPQNQIADLKLSILAPVKFRSPCKRNWKFQQLIPLFYSRNSNSLLYSQSQSLL